MSKKHLIVFRLEPCDLKLAAGLTTREVHLIPNMKGPNAVITASFGRGSLYSGIENRAIVVAKLKTQYNKYNTHIHIHVHTAQEPFLVD